MLFPITERRDYYYRTHLDNLVKAEQAKVFHTRKGTFYVVKLPEGGSIAIRPEQVLDDTRDPELNYEREVEEVETITARAKELGMSVEEYTDGEYYLDDLGVPVRHSEGEESWEATEAAIIREENALLGKFGVVL